MEDSTIEAVQCMFPLESRLQANAASESMVHFLVSKAYFCVNVSLLSLDSSEVTRTLCVDCSLNKQLTYSELYTSTKPSDPCSTTLDELRLYSVHVNEDFFQPVVTLQRKAWEMCNDPKACTTIDALYVGIHLNCGSSPFAESSLWFNASHWRGVIELLCTARHVLPVGSPG